MQSLLARPRTKGHKWDFPEKNCIPPVEDIDFFEVDPPGFPVKFSVTPLEFSIFCIDFPGNPCFFPEFFGVPPGIPTNITLPGGNFLLISLTGGLTFFSGKSQ